MTNKKNDDDKVVNRILIVAALIVLVASVEAFMVGKSREVYDYFLSMNENASGDDFFGLVIINLLKNIIEPLLISLYIFFTYKKYGVPRIFKLAFGVIIALKIFNLVITFNLSSIFYYLLILLNLVFFIVIVTTPSKRR